MIKVNLLHNMGLAQASPAGVGSFGASSSSSSAEGDVSKQAAIKLLVILLFPIALFGFERMQLSIMESELQQVQQKFQAVEAERAKFGDAGPRVEQYNKQKSKIDKELEVVRGIAQVRLREVKALDALQSLIPNQTWLRKVTFVDKTVKVEGYTSSEEGISNLIRSLESSAFFSRVEPKGTSQEALPTGNVKKFELEFQVGKNQ